MKMDEQFIRAWINPRNVSVARRIEVDTIPKEAYSPFLAIHLISVTFDRRQERTFGIIGLAALLREFLLLGSIVLYFISAAGSLYDNLARKRWMPFCTEPLVIFFATLLHYPSEWRRFERDYGPPVGFPGRFSLPKSYRNDRVTSFRCLVTPSRAGSTSSTYFWGEIRHALRRIFLE